MKDQFSLFVHESEAESQKEIVGITVYFLETEWDQDKVETSDVRSFIEGSRIHLNSDIISARMSNLQDEGLLTIVSGNTPYRYRMTFEGLEKFDEMAPELEEPDKVRDDFFIDIDAIEVEYYSKLVNHINISYQYGINDGCLVLTRKLFENFIIDILRAEYGGQEINLYFNTENGRFHGLGTLCGNIQDKASDLGHYSRELDNGLIDRVKQFKERGNSQAHSVRVDVDTDELEVMSEEATELAKTLYDIREEVRIANG